MKDYFAWIAIIIATIISWWSALVTGEINNRQVDPVPVQSSYPGPEPTPVTYDGMAECPSGYGWWPGLGYFYGDWPNQTQCYIMVDGEPKTNP